MEKLKSRNLKKRKRIEEGSKKRISKTISETYKGGVDCGDAKKNSSPPRSGKEGPQRTLKQVSGH